MIVPNLMVSDMGRAAGFWRDGMGFAVKMSVDAARETLFDDQARPETALFVLLERDGDQLMLQTADSLAEDAPGFERGLPDRPGGALYLRGADPDAQAAILREAGYAPAILKAPETTWYGMRELWLRDPDGHVACLARPEGPAPE